MVHEENLQALQNEYILTRFFHEIPDEQLALLAMILLIVVSIISLTVTLWTRCWFMLLVPITGFLIAFGYYCRICMISNPKIVYFAVMQILLIVPPLLLAAANYECLGQALRGDNYIPIAFIAFDIICLAIQLFGGSLLTSKDPVKLKLGINAILVGIVLATIANVAFIGILIYMNSKMSLKYELLIALYATMSLLLLRNVYRLIEFLQSKQTRDGSGFLASHEMYMYLFDFSTVFVCLIIFTVLHYGFYL